MNSDDERRIFTEFGWEYDYVKRVWTAPDGATCSTDDLVTYTETVEGHHRLVRFITLHGNRARSRA